MSLSENDISDNQNNMRELEEMRSFVQLVDAGTATKAAKIRGVAVSAISRRIKELEERLGVQLLKRTTRTMSLTEEGSVFYERSVQILAALADAEAEVTKQRNELKGTLKVTAPLSFGVAHLSPAISEFMSKHENMMFHVDLSDRRVDLVEEGFDIAIRIGELEDSSLKARRIGKFRHVVCASPNFWKSNGIPMSPEDLAGLDGLCYSNLDKSNRWKFFDQNGNMGFVTVETRLLSSNGETIRDAAKAGLGVLCEPSFIVHKAIDDGTLVPVLTDYLWYDMSIYAVYPSTRHLSTKVRAFIDFLVNRFGEQPYWEDCLERSLNKTSK